METKTTIDIWKQIQILNTSKTSGEYSKFGVVKWVKVDDIKALIMEHELCSKYHKFKETPDSKYWFEETCLLNIMRELSQSKERS